MFNINTLDMFNFRSYRGAHSFDFPTKPGLYSLTGQNQVNPRLASNDCGKSTLLEAIFWCLYGKTSRGLKAGDVITWGETTCEVSTAITLRRNQHLIRRVQAPNSLTLDGNAISQADLEIKLGLGPDQFSYAVMLPQFGDSFFDLSPSDKLSLFSQIMRLDYWLVKSKGAGDIAKELLETKQQHELKLTHFKGQLVTVKDDIKSLETQAKDFGQHQLKVIAEIKEKQVEVRRHIKALQRDLPLIKNALVIFNKRREIQGRKLDAKHAELEAVRHSIQLSSFEEAVHLTNLSEISTAVSNLAAQQGVCATCQQPLDREAKQATIAKLTQQLADSQDKIDGVRIQSHSLNKKLTLIKGELTELKDDDEVMLHNLTDQRNDEHKLGWELEAKILLEARLSAQIEDEKQRPNPHTVMLEQKKLLLKETSLLIAAETKELESVIEDHAAIEFWVAGFKRIRLYVIETSLQQLEIEVNNNLASLGLLGWKVTFDVERENKAGGVTKGFTVLIHAPDWAHPVKWEAFSGGATQRLRLAGNLGLANLIMERAGLVSQVEFYDEFSAHLSTAGIEDVLETLLDRATDTSRCIWVIDHHSLDFGGFGGVLQVIKTDKGSELQWK